MVLPSIAQLASKHGIRPLKKFGQNFIYDESLCDKIVAESGLVSGEVAIEIGPGPAGLTRSILKKNPKRLFVIETDERCIPLLSELQTIYPNLTVIYGDAKKFSIANIVKQNDIDSDIRIIANLPYNIGTMLLTNWLKEVDVMSSMTLMLQKEVVDRIVADTSTKNYGRLSVFCQLICNLRKCFDVSPKAFYPSPSVWSSIVHLEPKAETIDNGLLMQVEHITNMAFSGRRKMIKSSLSKLLSSQNIEQNITIEDLLLSCQIDPAIRAENLSPCDYLRLASYLN